MYKEFVCEDTISLRVNFFVCNRGIIRINISIFVRILGKTVICMTRKIVCRDWGRLYTIYGQPVIKTIVEGVAIT